MSINSIGSFQFISLDPPPEPPKEDVDAIQRQGVNGTAFWLTGNRGHETVSESFVDSRDQAHAWQLWLGYQSLIGTVATCVHAGMATVTQGFRVAVKDVKLKRMHKFGATSGGINPPSAWGVWAEWHLIAVSND